MPQARRQLAQLLASCRFSSTYLTPPVGDPDQPPFWNQGATGFTALSPEQLHAKLLEIEAANGRVRNPARPYGPRTLDLDLLLYDSWVGQFGQLTLPAPLLAKEAFVLIPAAEVAPTWVHPVLGVSLQELAAQMPAQNIRKLGEEDLA
jgi:2-amino-4-hydroxy-6-hydroxymethyldihydropteridine diphosphokinase